MGRSQGGAITGMGRSQITERWRSQVTGRWHAVREGLRTAEGQSAAGGGGQKETCEIGREIILVGSTFHFLGVYMGNYRRWSLFTSVYLFGELENNKVLGRKYWELLEML